MHLVRPIESDRRQPPDSVLYAERRILGALLRDFDAVLPLVADLTPAGFWSPSRQVVFEAILKTGNGDVIAVGDTLHSMGCLDAVGGPMALVSALDDCGTTVGIDRAVRIVQAEWRRRDLSVALEMALQHQHESIDEFELAVESIVIPAMAACRPTVPLYDAADLQKDDSPYELAMVGPGLIGEGDLALVVGPPKAQKSYAALDLIRSLCLGESWLDELHPQRPLKVAMIQLELKRDSVRRRLAGDDLPRGQFVLTGRHDMQLDPATAARLAPEIRRMLSAPPDMLVFDPLANIYTGESENDNTQMREFLRSLYAFRDRINPKAAVIVVHHSSKQSRQHRSEDPFNAIRGAGALRGAYDFAMFVDRVSEDSDVRRVHFEARNGPEPPPMKIQLENGRFVRTDETERLVGQTIGERWDAERARKADRIIQLICTSAFLDEIYTQNGFARQYGGQDGLGSFTSLRAFLREMTSKRLVMRFDAREALGGRFRRYDGHLCTPGMEWRRDSGALLEIRPEHHWSNSHDRLVEITGEAGWKKVSDYYGGGS